MAFTVLFVDPGDKVKIIKIRKEIGSSIYLQISWQLAVN
jgi:hypothetical protein